MNEALQKFKETLSLAKTIAVRSGDTKNISKILSAHVLHSAFLELEKQSSVDCGEIDELAKKHLDILLENSEKNSEAPEHTLIKIDTEKIPISELKYEKDGSVLKIILRSPVNFDSQKIVIEKEKIPVDLLLLVDPEEKEVEKITKNTPHKEVVKITSKEKNISLKTFEIVSMLGPQIANKFREALWVLLEQENEFSKNVFLAKKEILDMNPDFSKIFESKEALKTKWFWKLLGRALQRSETEKESGTIWTFVTPEDFEKTNANENFILPILNEIRKLRYPKNVALLWQKNKGESVKAVVVEENNQKPKFTEGFDSFSEAEIKIRSEIKKVLQ